RFFVLGTPKPYKQALHVVHPETILDESADGEAAPAGVRVRYPEVEGVPARTLEKLCAHVAERYATCVPEGIPPSGRERAGLLPQATALAALHRPPADLDGEAIAALNEGTAPAQRRLVFDEFFFLQLGLARRRGNARREAGLAFFPGASDRAATALS